MPWERPGQSPSALTKTRPTARHRLSGGEGSYTGLWGSESSPTTRNPLPPPLPTYTAKLSSCLLLSIRPRPAPSQPTSMVVPRCSNRLPKLLWTLRKRPALPRQRLRILQPSRVRSRPSCRGAQDILAFLPSSPPAACDLPILTGLQHRGCL